MDDGVWVDVVAASAEVVLEVQVRQAGGVSRVAHVADHGAGGHPTHAHVLVRREMRVVVVVAGIGVDVRRVPADTIGPMLQTTTLDRQHRRSRRRDEVVALVPTPVMPRITEIVEMAERTRQRAHPAAHRLQNREFGLR